MTNQTKPAQRELWIRPQSGLFINPEHIITDVMSTPSKYPEDIHVIEYSAFQSVCKERDELKKKYQELMTWAKRFKTMAYSVALDDRIFQEFDRWKEGGK